MARDEKVIIKINSDVKERFQSMAESYGMTMSSLGAFAISRMVKEEETRYQLNEKAIEMMVGQGIEKAEDMFSEDNLRKILEPLFLKMLDQEGVRNFK